jgi:hypothetical protein
MEQQSSVVGLQHPHSTVQSGFAAFAASLAASRLKILPAKIAKAPQLPQRKVEVGLLRTD